MSKKIKKEDAGRTPPSIKEKTRQGILAIIFFVLAVLFVLASMGRAGPVGDSLYSFLTTLLGLGYFLVPIIFVMLGVSFLKTITHRFPIVKIVGSTIFLLAGLGMIDIVGKNQGGVIGRVVATPLIKLFDVYASVLVLGALFIISILIILETELTLEPLIGWWKKSRAKKMAEKWDESDTKKEDLEELSLDEPDEEEKLKNKADKKTVNQKTQNETKEEFMPNKNSQTPARLKTLGVVFAPPPLSLLERDKGKPVTGDINANKNIIKRTLANFGIDVEMDEISIGPSVTRYALKPAEGVKLSKIVALQNDLSLALAAHPLRIEAPIPGKSLVGIEIPNSTKSIVGLATMLSSEEYQISEKPLLISLGKGISGKSHFANLAKMPHLLIAGTTGSGKTCAKDTYIFSEKGILTFEELCPLPLNSEVNYSLRVATRDGLETTSKNYNNGICDFYKITTEEGLSIEVTFEHPLWVIKDSVMDWQNGGSIKIGEYVAISRGSKLFGENEKIDFTPTPNKTNKAREIKTPTIMTEKLGLFMGLLTADGGLTIKHRIVYTQANEEVLGIYLTLLKDLFGISAPIVAKSGASNKAKDVVVNSKQLKDFLKYLDLKPVGAREKEIPKSIREAKPEIIKSFIQGLIRNDGHISAVKGLEITLATEKLLKQLQVILLNFGIVSSIHLKKVKGYKENSYWRLTIYGAEFVTYAREIGFLTNEEEQKSKRLLALHRNTNIVPCGRDRRVMNELADSSTRVAETTRYSTYSSTSTRTPCTIRIVHALLACRNKNIIPTLKPVLKKLSQMYRGAFARLTNKGWLYEENMLVPKYAFKSLASYNSGDRNPSYEALQKILTFYEPLAESADYKKVAQIREDNFYWAKVAKIEKTVGEGYDFEVPGSNSFVGNGFVNHNSVTIHTIITSLLFRNAVENLKFIMIDPKRVELTLYNKIPHLLTPVITEAKKAILSLKWAAKEMDRRYDILEAESVRDIESYHKNILAPELKKLEEQLAEGGDAFEAEMKMPELMPYIVIVIDELADIMSTYPRELEAAIVRLAQMSRAVGIHLILSTQRPSVNVITGLIKANIPGRVAMQVSSQIDSRTILDTGGAEKLLGAGDMLFLGSEMSKPQRIQSAFISESEVKKVVNFLKENYDSGIPSELNLTPEAVADKNAIFESSFGENNSDEEIDDDLYEQAREEVMRSGRASTSYLQRKFRVGYARAARLMDVLEERGVIGPADGAKPREVMGATPASQSEELPNESVQ